MPNREQKQRFAMLLRQLQCAAPFVPIAVQMATGELIVIEDPYHFLVDAERLYVLLAPAKHVRSISLIEITRIGRQRESQAPAIL